MYYTYPSAEMTPNSKSLNPLSVDSTEIQIYTDRYG